ncbi:MAG: 2-dehydropantoate 2-reductase N-terminal domain-containing protein, partial [Pseudomonadota bacterium]
MSFKITILGAGAIGCALAAAWSGRGAPLSLYARPARTDALADGVTLAWEGRTEHVSADTLGLTTDPAALHADLVVITTKATAITSLTEKLAHTSAPILSLMNGPLSAAALGDALNRSVLRGMVPWNAAWHATGALLVSGAGAVTAEPAPETNHLAQIAQTSPAPVRVRADLEEVLWGKLLLNLVNPVNALSGLPLDQMLAQRD